MGTLVLKEIPKPSRYFRAGAAAMQVNLPVESVKGLRENPRAHCSRTISETAGVFLQNTPQIPDKAAQ